MSNTVNKVILVGNLGKDPEIHYFSDGTAKATFPLATTEVFVDKNTNEKKSTTDWHNIVMYRKQAEIAEKFLKKGSKIYLEGKLKSRSWEDAEKRTRYITEVIVETFIMLDKPPQNEGDKLRSETASHDSDHDEYPPNDVMPF
jgi:single-strand DNA-binding protein